MHNKILCELFATHGLKDAESQAAYLQSLKPYAIQIWEAYQNQAISIDYSNLKAQEAYLLRYFTPYSYLISTVLGDMGERGMLLFGHDDLLKVSVFGCGPGPEMAGLIRHLKTISKRPQMLYARMLDVASDAWSHGRAIAHRGIISGEWDPSLIQIDSAHIDIASEAPFPDQDADLLVFQNCLNELNSEKQKTVEVKLRNTLSAAPTATTMMLIEQQGYDSTDELLRRLQQWANETTDLYAAGQSGSFDCWDLPDRIPELILQHLFVRRRDRSPVQSHERGLILRSKVKYRWLTIAKKP